MEFMSVGLFGCRDYCAIGLFWTGKILLVGLLGCRTIGLSSINIHSAKKVRKHCIDEGISQCRFGVEQQGVYQYNDESMRNNLTNIKKSDMVWYVWGGGVMYQNLQIETKVLTLHIGKLSCNKSRMRTYWQTITLALSS